MLSRLNGKKQRHIETRVVAVLPNASLLRAAAHHNHNSWYVVFTLSGDPLKTYSGWLERCEGIDRIADVETFEASHAMSVKWRSEAYGAAR